MAQNSRSMTNICSISTASKKMVEIVSTIKNVSQLPSKVALVGPDVCIASGGMACVSFKKDAQHLYVYLRNKSNKQIDFKRTVVLYDFSNRVLHKETDPKIFSLKKDQDVDLIDAVDDRRRYDILYNDTLVIKVCLQIQKPSKKRPNHPDLETKLKADFKTMLENPINSDVSLNFGKERIRAHWSVLCARSPYFRRMFEAEMKERVENSVTITEISIKTFKILLEFVYTSNFVLGDQGKRLEDLFELYYAADKYEMMDLRALCADEMMNKASPANVCQILQIAYRHSDRELKTKVADFIQQHPEPVLLTDGWKQFEADEPSAAEAFSFFLKKNHL